MVDTNLVLLNALRQLTTELCTGFGASAAFIDGYLKSAPEYQCIFSRTDKVYFLRENANIAPNPPILLVLRQLLPSYDLVWGPSLSVTKADFRTL